MRSHRYQREVGDPDEPASDQLWVTARDGDVVLTTSGDGVFKRE